MNARGTCLLACFVIAATGLVFPKIGYAEETVEASAGPSWPSPLLFDPTPLRDVHTFTGTAEAEPLVPLPVQPSVVTGPPKVEPSAKTPEVSADRFSVEPPGKQQRATTLAAGDVQPSAQEAREKPTKRDHVATGNEASPEPVASRQKTRRVKGPAFRIAVIRNRPRVHRVSLATSRPLRGFSATMDATRYRVGRALGCFVQFRCTRRQVGGTVVGAAAGGAAGGGGGAVAGGFLGAVVASRGR
jgi:hypothetical protein